MNGRGLHITAASLVAIVLAAIAGGCGGSGSLGGHGSPTSPAGSSSSVPTSAAPSSSAAPTSATPSGVVPQVDGAAVDVAELYLRKAGLALGRQIQQTNSDVEDGLVITSQPPVGQKEPLGTSIELVISKGSAGCQPPGPSCDHLQVIGAMINVLGDSLPQAISSLALSGLTLGSTTVVGSSAQKGTVVCTNPPAEVNFDVEDPVSVGLSSGVPGVPATSGCGGLTSGATPSPSPTPPPSPSPF
jgi:eukaryotic-like serine/threonine-protein kinase